MPNAIFAHFPGERSMSDQSEQADRPITSSNKFRISFFAKKFCLNLIWIFLLLLASHFFVSKSENIIYKFDYKSDNPIALEKHSIDYIRDEMYKLRNPSFINYLGEILSETQVDSSMSPYCNNIICYIIENKDSRKINTIIYLKKKTLRNIISCLDEKDDDSMVIIDCQVNYNIARDRNKKEFNNISERNEFEIERKKLLSIFEQILLDGSITYSHSEFIEDMNKISNIADYEMSRLQIIENRNENEYYSYSIGYSKIKETIDPIITSNKNEKIEIIDPYRPLVWILLKSLFISFVLNIIPNGLGGVFSRPEIIFSGSISGNN